MGLALVFGGSQDPVVTLLRVCDYNSRRMLLMYSLLRIYTHTSTSLCHRTCNASFTSAVIFSRDYSLHISGFLLDLSFNSLISRVTRFVTTGNCDIAVMVSVLVIGALNTDDHELESYKYERGPHVSISMIKPTDPCPAWRSHPQIGSASWISLSRVERGE
jgi:hypothetical protein